MQKKEYTRREMFKELLSKDTIKQVAGAWYGFSQPVQEGLNTQQKPGTLMDKVRQKEALFMRTPIDVRDKDRKEG